MKYRVRAVVTMIPVIGELIATKNFYESYMEDKIRKSNKMGKKAEILTKSYSYAHGAIRILSLVEAAYGNFKGFEVYLALSFVPQLMMFSSEISSKMKRLFSDNIVQQKMTDFLRNNTI